MLNSIIAASIVVVTCIPIERGMLNGAVTYQMPQSGLVEVCGPPPDPNAIIVACKVKDGYATMPYGDEFAPNMCLTADDLRFVPPKVPGKEVYL